MHFAGEAHRVFVTDEAEAGKRIGERIVKAEFFDQPHRVGVFHALGNLYAASAALPDSVAIQVSIEAGADSVHALVHVDAGLDRFFAVIGAVRNFNFFILFDELDNRHVFDRNRELEIM